MLRLSVILQSLSWLSVTPWRAACQASLSFTISRSSRKLTSTELVMLSNSLILCHPFSFCLQSFLGGQSIGTSALEIVLSMNIQGCYSLGLAGLVSVHSKGLSRISSSTTVQKHQFFDTQPSL